MSPSTTMKTSPKSTSSYPMNTWTIFNSSSIPLNYFSIQLAYMLRWKHQIPPPSTCWIFRAEWKKPAIRWWKMFMTFWMWRTGLLYISTIICTSMKTSHGWLTMNQAKPTWEHKPCIVSASSTFMNPSSTSRWECVTLKNPSISASTYRIRNTRIIPSN